MGQWSVFKPLPIAVSLRDGVLGVPRLVGGGSKDVRDLSICCGKDWERVGFGHFFGWRGAAKPPSHSRIHFHPKGGLRPG